MTRLEIDHESVLDAAMQVAAVAQRLDGAPAGPALQLAAAAVPGGRLADAAGVEATEWQQEISELLATFDRYAGALRAAVDTFLILDEQAARRLAAGP